MRLCRDDYRKDVIIKKNYSILKLKLTCFQVNYGIF
jgi:hypothetical protein